MGWSSLVDAGYRPAVITRGVVDTSADDFIAEEAFLIGK